jgi:hypothetical protein
MDIRDFISQFSGSCGHSWIALSNSSQICCPLCGIHQNGTVLISQLLVDDWGAIWRTLLEIHEREMNKEAVRLGLKKDTTAKEKV